jgi:hypothetical protein
LADEQLILIRKLQSEGKHIEARDRASQLKRINEMIILLNTEVRKQQEQRQREQMTGSSQPQNHAARVSMDLSTRVSQPAATSTNSAIPNSMGTGISDASTGGHVHIGSGVGATSIAPASNSTQSEQQATPRSWRGILCVGTGNDQTRLNADILVALTAMRATTAE